MSSASAIYPVRQRPLTAGPGFRFLDVGELRRPGDQFYGPAGWRRAVSAYVVVAAAARRLYRRRVHKAKGHNNSSTPLPAAAGPVFVRGTVSAGTFPGK